MLCVSKALNNYFLDDIPIMETFKKLSILDFCKTFTATGNWTTEYHYLKDSKFHVESHSKTTRYFISNKGGVLFKCHPDGRSIMVESKMYVKLANNIDNSLDLSNYDINYNYYLNECNKIINKIIPRENYKLEFDYE